MKTINKQIKTIGMILILAFSINLVAQKEQDKKLFIRVFNLEGKKINKGHFQFINDSLLGLRRNRKAVQINVKDIGKIKTKRSAGHNVFLGSVIGGGTLALVGVVSTESERQVSYDMGYWGTFNYTSNPATAGQNFAAGLVLGGVAGAAVGGITAIFKNSRTYIVDGKIENLRICANDISKK